MIADEPAILDYEAIETGERIRVALDDAAAVYDFGNGKSFYKGFQIATPNRTGLVVSVESLFSSAAKKYAHIVYPTLNEYDDGFELVQTSNVLLEAQKNFVSGTFFRSVFLLNPKTRYFVIFADPQHFGKTQDWTYQFYASGPLVYAYSESSEKVPFGPGGPLRVELLSIDMATERNILGDDDAL